MANVSETSTRWQRELAEAIRDPDELIDRLSLPVDEAFRVQARAAAADFPVLVPHSFLERIEPGNLCDPLLRQVLPVARETENVPGFSRDAVGDRDSRQVPGLLQKYAGRALLIASGACAVHCRYCFRRHYPYQDDPRRLTDWEPALEYLRADSSLSEVLLSGGDPLTLSDRRLEQLVQRLEEIPHLRRLRIHSRLPIVLPSRITPSLAALLQNTRLTPIVVVHANHARELAGDCGEQLRNLVRSGITVLNQAVLLRGVNETLQAQVDLNQGLIDLGVMPYYLHQLDRVAGAAHFEVPEEQGQSLINELRNQLPGYAVPRYVRELPGVPHKTPL